MNKTSTNRGIIRMPLVVLLVSTLLLTFLPTAQADVDPPGCSQTGVTISMGVFRADGITPIPGGAFVQHGETIIYQTFLSFAGAPNCAFQWGTILIDPPGPTGPTNVTPTTGVPLCGPGCTVSSQQLLYVVDHADESPPGNLPASTSYSGKSHFDADDEDVYVATTISSKVAHPSTNLTKTASPTSGLAPLVVTYTYNEINDGNTPLTNVSVEDDSCSPVTYVSGDTNGNNKLDPGETWAFTCSVTLNTPGSFTNTAIGNGTDPFGNYITYPAYPTERARATVTVMAPNTTLTKTASPTSGLAPLVVTYTYREENTGDVNLTNVYVVDDGCSPVTYVSGDDGDGVLNPGETWVFICTRTYSESGTFTNTAIGNGTDPFGNHITYPAYPSERATATVVVSPPGCEKPECKITGVGYILGKYADKASFGITGLSSKGVVTGYVEYTDNDLRIKSTSIISVRTSADKKKGWITGHAQISGLPDSSHYFEVYVEDNLDTMKGDYFKISVPGYTNGNYLISGHIRIWE